MIGESQVHFDCGQTRRLPSIVSVCEAEPFSFSSMVVLAKSATSSFACFRECRTGRRYSRRRDGARLIFFLQGAFVS